MNPFDVLVDDIFGNADFAESCTVSGRSMKCVVSSIDRNAAFTEFGEDAGVGFSLTIRAADYPNPSKGDRLTYRGTVYRVDRSVLDSAGKTVNVYLKNR